jgi:pimeloyl-ACP methyl ester carboxylesterase
VHEQRRQREQPAIVLLPGMDGTGKLFAPLIDRLKGAATPVAVSYPTTEPLGYTELIALARKALPENQPYVLLGESFSGPIAIRLAAERPNGLIGLALCASFVSSPMSWLRPFRSLLPAAPIGILARTLGPKRLMGRFQTPALTQLVREVLSRVSTRVLRARIRAAMDVDASTQLAQVDVPTIYMRATEDALLPRAAVDQYRRSAAAGSVVDIIGPHSLALCVPEAVSDTLSEFASSSARTFV